MRENVKNVQGVILNNNNNNVGCCPEKTGHCVTIIFLNLKKTILLQLCFKNVSLSLTVIKL